MLVAQDLASYGRDLGLRRPGQPVPIEGLVRAVSARVTRTRLLYLYPSELSDGLIDVMGATGCPYFDLSLQHVSRPLLRRMRRWGDRRPVPGPDRAHPSGLSRCRPAFLLHRGLPGRDRGGPRPAAGVPGRGGPGLGGILPFLPRGGDLRRRPPGPGAAGAGGASAWPSAASCRTPSRPGGAATWSGRSVRVLVDEPGVARSHREAPEIDGVIRIPSSVPVGEWVDVMVTGAEGPDLDAELVAAAVP